MGVRDGMRRDGGCGWCEKGRGRGWTVVWGVMESERKGREWKEWG